MTFLHLVSLWAAGFGLAVTALCLVGDALRLMVLGFVPLPARDGSVGIARTGSGAARALLLLFAAVLAAAAAYVALGAATAP